MSLADDKFPSSVAFDAINQALQSDTARREDAVKKTKAVFGFNLKNGAGETEGWYVDLKDKGVVGKGAGPKADGEQTLYLYQRVRLTVETATLSMSDEDFGKLVQGRANAQNLFMAGKLKIKGNMMMATKLEPVLKQAQTQAKL
ncbi:MAG: hypothetical protein Q9227_000532 [Pyrenula ochraceoflavens]